MQYSYAGGTKIDFYENEKEAIKLVKNGITL